ncbi:MAG: AarF/ABC1/UbiB kinase family protein [Planctomycetales bacterium]|nr:AarF/ABC1/UbiB kinase family protein [Planctomycetales bacterium]
MKISTIPQLYRNVRRWQEILAILRRYGLADWLSQLKFDFIRDWIKDEQGVPLARYSREKRIRLALTELGPTFIKLGQVLSLRPDLIGPQLATELTLLQSQLPADPPDQVREVVERELGASIEELFLEFGPEAIASASIGQVHRARLKDGTDVVVKVQHADIQAKVREDLEVMAGLATLAEHVPELATWKPQVLVEQLSKSLRRELNFTRELQNLQLFRRELQGVKRVRIPKPFAKLSTTRVLTMEYLAGQSVNCLSSDDNELVCDQASRQSLARLAAVVYVEMIFTHGVYHADPHPGNVLIDRRPGEDELTLGLLDFGMVGRIDDRLRETIEEMLLAVASRDASLLTTLIKRVGNSPPRLDESTLSIDVADLVATYGSQPLESFDLSGALSDVTDIMHRHQISLPPQTSLLIKMLITLEGTLHQLSPTFSLLEVMQPFFRKMWLRRLSPRRQAKRIRRIYIELESLLETLPGQISNVMQLLQEGRLDVHLAHKGLSPSVNRMVLGLLISSVFLGSTLLLAFKVPPLLFLQRGWMGIEQLSLFGLIGYAVSLIAVLRLIRAINRSGHLDRSDSD